MATPLAQYEVYRQKLNYDAVTPFLGAGFDISLPPTYDFSSIVRGLVFTDQTGTDAIALAASLRIWPLDSDVRKAYADSSLSASRHYRAHGTIGHR